MPNDVFADWSVHSVAPVELPLQILFPPKSLKRPLLPPLGQLSVAHTEIFYTRNVKPGRRRLIRAFYTWSSVAVDRLPHGSWTCAVVDVHRCPKLHRYFDEKIAGVRASAADAAPPSYVAATPHCDFSAFRVLTNDDVIAAIRKLSDKQCATDPLPTNLLKESVDVLTPFISELFNRSMSMFPSHFKAAFITPLLKKPNLDPYDGKSYIDLLQRPGIGRSAHRRTDPTT